MEKSNAKYAYVIIYNSPKIYIKINSKTYYKIYE